MANEKDTPIYRVIRVPRDSPRLPDLAAKSRAARLHALHTDPTSFLSQHATESALPPTVWQTRLSHPETAILIAVATCSPSAADDETVLLDSEWAGFAAVRGPMKYADYYVSPDQGLPVPRNPHEEARWHVYDVYTLPAHRGRGLAKWLAKGLGAEGPGAEGLELKQARIRLFVDPRNAWVVKVYEGLGFRAAGSATLEEGFRANMLEESIPRDTRVNAEVERLWHARFGLAMERIVRV
ncbi:hypothetical protein C7974DRAFT_323471 [Boeremia exigua]|uniref:uncharacterized protein n=1 Tax=Boeremia exigua TaxID=749465 RepID=UPI001E8CA367|nr:uncharacterized protein C7974DRAFT_323471 [Boeremia exigua]KAH6612029.1 hypothetical protein C7974DRAFT_323471 [Boeremia exigua]